MPFDRPDGIRPLVGNIAEVAVGDSSVWISVAVYVEMPGPTGVAIARRSKGIRRGCAEGACAVVNSCCGARSRRGIRAVPVIDAPVHDLQLAILVRPRVTVTIGIIY